MVSPRLPRVPAVALAVLAAGALLSVPRGVAAQTGTAPPAQIGPQPPPAAPPPGFAPAVEAPVPGDPNLGPPAPIAPLPSAPPPPAVEAGTADLSAPVAVAPEPFYQKWWFWTAVGAFAVTAVVIVLASSDSGPPRTDLGNMPAF